MKLSIITVAFQAERTIARAAASVLGQRQTGFELEYIVVDGASQDGTLAALEPYRGQIDQLISEPDEGLYDAMNKGWQAATGDFVGFLNADDAYADDHVLARVAAVAAGVGGVYGDLVYVDGEQVTRHWVSGAYRPGAFRRGWMPPHPTFFARREAFANWGGFRTELRSAADYELMLRFIHVHGLPLAYVPEVLVRMEVGGVSNASWRHRLRANREDRKAWELNRLRPWPWTRWLKPLRKMGQFIKRPR
jgi:glycosyltransferase involved in cell wall biosynthesis